MAGAVDLFSGTASIHGANLFQVDKDPLQQLDGGIQSVVGKQASNTGSGIVTGIEALLRAILGFGGLEGPIEIGSEILGTLLNLTTYFGNVEDFLGELNPLDPDFNPILAVENFITAMMKPIGLLAFLVPHGGDSAGLSGFIPIENLALDLIEGAIGGIQAVIDMLLSAFGFPPGTGTRDTVDQLFANLLSFLGDIDLFSGSFNPIDAAIKFFTLILHVGVGGVAVGATDVLGAIIGDTLIMPFTMGGDSGPVPQWFIDIPQAIEDLITNVFNAFARLDPTGTLGRFGTLMQQAFDLFNGLFTRTATLSASVTALEQQVFGEVGSNGITFAFQGPTASLSTLDWTMINAGAPGMDFTQQSDYVKMTGSAGSDATLIAIYDTSNSDPAKHFTSHIQSCTYLPREQIASSGSTALYMPLRTNNATSLASLNTCYARVARGGSGGTVDCGILLGGVATDLAAIPGADPDLVSASNLSLSNNDRFDFTLGDPNADPILQADQYNWRWRWYLNNALIIDTVFNPVLWNPVTANLLNSSIYNCASFGMTADFIFIFLPAMVPPTTLDGLAYYTPAAA